MPLDKRVNKGTTAGLFGDFSDTPGAFALFQPDPNNDEHCPHLLPFSRTLEFILDADTPPDLTNTLSSNYFMALQKEPTDHTKLCPVGWGVPVRHRVAGKCIMELHGQQFTSFLLPQGQFGVSITGSTPPESKSAAFVSLPHSSSSVS